MLMPVVIVKRDVQFVRESVHDCRADAKAGERTGAGHKSNFGDVGEIGMIFL